MNRTIRLIVFAVMAIGLLGAGIGVFLYNKPHVDVADIAPEASIKASDLFAAFETDEVAANTQYLDQAVAVTGRLAEISETQDGGRLYMLRGAEDMFGVNCAFLPEDVPSPAPDIGTDIQIKGLVIGMDLDVNLSRCVLVK